MPASLDDILTTQKNGVVGINGVSDTLYNLQGYRNSREISTTTLLQQGDSWVAKVSVIVAGSTTGLIYDAPSIQLAGVGNRIYVIDNQIGIQDVFLPANQGIVVEPGTGMILCVSFS
jgi:hypothetical protein